jgi:hypothetical protein
MTELKNRIIDAADQLRRNQEVMMGAVTLIVERDQMRVDNQSGHTENACRT